MTRTTTFAGDRMAEGGSRTTTGGATGADTCWPMHEEHGLPIDRIPDTIANTVQLIVDQLRTKARKAR